MQDFFKSSSIYFLGSLLNKVLGIILIPIYANILSVEEFGILSMVVIIFTLVSHMQLAGISSAAMRLYHDYENEIKRKILYGNATLLCIIIIPFSYLFFYYSISFTNNYILKSIHFSPLLHLSIIMGLLSPIQKLTIGLFRTIDKPNAFILFNFFFALINFSSIIIALFIFKSSILFVIYAQIFSNSVFFVISLIILVNYSIFKINTDLLIKISTVGMPLIPFFLFNWINKFANRFFLEHSDSLNELGLYSFSVRFSDMILLVLLALSNALLPYYYKMAKEDNFEEKLNDLIILLTAFIGLFSISIILFSNPFILLFIPQDYHSSLEYIPYLIFASGILLYDRFFYFSMMNQKRTKIISSISFLTTLVCISLLYIFILKKGYGIWGIIYSSIITNVFSIIAGYIFSQINSKIDYKFKKIIFLILFYISVGVAIHINLEISKPINYLFTHTLYLLSIYLVFNFIKKEFSNIWNR